MKLKILLTGGTIDKSYNESNGELTFEESYLSEMLALGRNKTTTSIEQLMLKDSLQMDEDDRQLILKACENSLEQHILITHGTDTMVQTAQILGEAKLNKSLVLVGAMVPFVFKHSDALFNLGFALGALQTLPVGVYIAMNGTVFSWDNVVKNLALGEFLIL
jgi:L-asparaginase